MDKVGGCSGCLRLVILNSGAICGKMHIRKRISPLEREERL